MARPNWVVAGSSQSHGKRLGDRSGMVTGRRAPKRRPDVEQAQLGDVRPTERLMREVGVIP